MGRERLIHLTTSVTGYSALHQAGIGKKPPLHDHGKAAKPAVSILLTPPFRMALVRV